MSDRYDVDVVMHEMLYHFTNRDAVRRMQAPYVAHFDGAKDVLDLGCGRGLFLDLLKEAGIAPVGVDGSEDAVAECIKRGHEDTHVGNVLEFLQDMFDQGRAFDGIFCSHLIEHLPGRAAIQLIAHSARVLRPGGRLLISTPNVQNLHVWTRQFWLDPTHVRPYPRQLIEATMKTVGLTIAASWDDARGRAGGMRPKGFLRFGRAGNLRPGRDCASVSSRRRSRRGVDLGSERSAFCWTCIGQPQNVRRIGGRCQRFRSAI